MQNLRAWNGMDIAVGSEEGGRFKYEKVMMNTQLKTEIHKN